MEKLKYMSPVLLVEGDEDEPPIGYDGSQGNSGDLESITFDGFE